MRMRQQDEIMRQQEQETMRPDNILRDEGLKRLCLFVWVWRRV